MDCYEEFADNSNNEIKDMMKTFDIPLDPKRWSTDDISNWFFWNKHLLRWTHGKISKNILNIRNDFEKVQSENIWIETYGESAGLSLFQKFQNWMKYYKETQKVPKRRNERKNGLYLWQILLQMLCEPKLFSKHIIWVDKHKGSFKFINPTEVARIWGLSKNNANMTYDKMSRSMRQYYKINLLKKEINDKLNYRFNMDDRSVKQFLNRHANKTVPSLHCLLRTSISPIKHEIQNKLDRKILNKSSNFHSKSSSQSPLEFNMGSFLQNDIEPINDNNNNNSRNNVLINSAQNSIKLKNNNNNFTSLFKSDIQSNLCRNNFPLTDKNSRLSNNYSENRQFYTPNSTQQFINSLEQISLLSPSSSVSSQNAKTILIHGNFNKESILTN